MIRTLDEELTVTNIPWALTKIPGGSMNHQKLCFQILNQIQTVNKVDPSAYSEILGKLEKLEPEIIHPHPPPFFKCCKLVSVDFDTKHVELNWLVATVADGCGVNHKAIEVLTNEIGWLTPARCSGHAASGSIKIIASSETFCPPEVVTFAAGLRLILKHFKLSGGKSTALLNDALLVMEMKPLKAMWCPTRMANLLTCSLHTVISLFPLCATITSCAIQAEQSAYFLFPMCINLPYLMADLEGLFVGTFLRKRDTNAAIVIEVFSQSESMVKSLQELPTPLNDEFLSGLKEDTNGNIIYEKVNNSTSEKLYITLQYSSRPTRWVESKLDIILRFNIHLAPPVGLKVS